MSITQRIKRFIGQEGSGVDVNEYRCNDCGHTYESAKRPTRSQCPECISDDVHQTS